AWTVMATCAGETTASMLCCVGPAPVLASACCATADSAQSHRNDQHRQQQRNIKTRKETERLTFVVGRFVNEIPPEDVTIAAVLALGVQALHLDLREKTGQTQTQTHTRTQTRTQTSTHEHTRSAPFPLLAAASISLAASISTSESSSPPVLTLPSTAVLSRSF